MSAPPNAPRPAPLPVRLGGCVRVTESKRQRVLVGSVTVLHVFGRTVEAERTVHPSVRCHHRCTRCRWECLTGG